jgi:hypothetical protein
MKTRVRTLLLSGLLTACSTLPEPDGTAGDPSRSEVRLHSGSDWNASLVIDTHPTGIWTVEVMQVFPQYASPEVVGLDDEGRCHVLVSYSGKWTPVTTIADGTWLGGLAQGDVDPRVPGPELYTGGKRGNLYQVVAHREGVADNRRIAHLPGREIHTLVAADLDERREGDELIAFTRPGGLFLLTPRERLDGFDVELVEDLQGRVRDAVWVPGRREVATVERSGRLRLLSWTAEGPRWRTLFERPMGMGRLAVTEREGRTVLYNTCDDGTIWRHAATDTDAFETEMIYAGPQGPRGLVSGRFDPDPAVETVAVFGYGARVELLSRTRGGWGVETIFTDRDKGHWLTKGELDGRNATDEIVLSGYGARVVLLSKPAGDGLDDVRSAP